MVGLVIAAHGHLADELVATAEQIVGRLPAVATCSINPGASPSEIRQKMDATISSVETGEGVIVLADLFGGTPCNQSISLTHQHHLEIVAGVNLPMLLKANSLRSEITSLPELASALAAYGQKNITCVSALLRETGATRNH